MLKIYNKFFNFLDKSKVKEISDFLKKKTKKVFENSENGNLPFWIEAYSNLSDIKNTKCNFLSSVVRIDSDEEVSQEKLSVIRNSFESLSSWKKGPFSVFGIEIDSEWRSDLKWDRIKDNISSLKGKSVLDLGCANGYHCFRMLSQKPHIVVGIDPSLKFVCQFAMINKYANVQNMSVLPIAIEDMPLDSSIFDTVFSMGLLYHRRSPFDHLIQVHSFLKEGGELLLETLIIDGKKGDVLMPEDRYACMPNIWFIPSVDTLKMWLVKCRFKDIEICDITKTTDKEQRATKWAAGKSLIDFFDPKDPCKTIEGYPAPKRVVIKAKK